MNGCGLAGYAVALAVLARACWGVVRWSVARPGKALLIDPRDGRVHPA
jgi:hypothetical protein